MDRLDVALVKRNLIKSRERAKFEILNGKISVNGNTIKKPSFNVGKEDNINIVDKLNYVSRGGLKLEKAIKVFKVDVKGKDCIDLGASTGGFTDCLLKYGAKSVLAIDVGKNQLDQSLINNQKVKNIEGLNIKDIEKDYFTRTFDIVVGDLSFISISFAIEKLKYLLDEKGASILLLKPQFEVGKEFLDKNGVVKDNKQIKKTIARIEDIIKKEKLRLVEIQKSPITGKKGNVEYLLYIIND